MNKTNVLALADFIENTVSSGDKLIDFDMSTTLAHGDCGAVACIAGFECIRTKQQGSVGELMTLAAVALGLEHADQVELFMPENAYADWAAERGDADDYVSRADAVLALRLLAERGSMDGVWRDVRAQQEVA